MLKNVNEKEIKKALCLSESRFNNVLERVSGGKIRAEYCLDGIIFNTTNDETIEDVDAIVLKKLSEYFGVTVTSVHMDDYDDIGVWVIYTED